MITRSSGDIRVTENLSYESFLDCIRYKIVKAFIEYYKTHTTSSFRHDHLKELNRRVKRFFFATSSSWMTKPNARMRRKPQMPNQLLIKTRRNLNRASQNVNIRLYPWLTARLTDWHLSAVLIKCRRRRPVTHQFWLSRPIRMATGDHIPLKERKKN